MITKISPPHSVVLLMDAEGGQIQIPASMQQRLVAATDSCIAVGTRSEGDGKTEIRLETEPPSDGGQLAYEGTLMTPSKTVAVKSVLGVILLESSVPSAETKVRIWVDDPREPDKIIIGIQEP